MFRWPDEDPVQRDPWTALRQDVRWRISRAGRSLRAALAAVAVRRGRLSSLSRNRPLPIAFVLACGLGSAAWAWQNMGFEFGVFAAQTEHGGGLVAEPDTRNEPQPQTQVKTAPPQWGDPLPSRRSSGAPEAISGTPALPPATPRRNAGTVVLASQYFGIAPYEPTPSQRGNLIAVLTEPTQASSSAHSADGSEASASKPGANAPGTRATSTVTAELAPSPLTREVAGVQHASLGVRPLPGSPMTQIGDWIGLADSLALGGSSASARSGEQALTLPQAVELGRLQQRRLLEQRVGHRPDAQRSLTASESAAHPGRLSSDPGYRAAQVFLEALQARMNLALVQRHERQINRVVSQARAAWAQKGQSSPKGQQATDQALRQARARLTEAQAAQKLQIERLIPLIGQVPQALTWGPASELGLPASSRQVLAEAVANRWAGDQHLASSTVLDAFARQETNARRKLSLHGTLIAHAQVAGALHGQLLRGQRDLADVIQAYEKLHLSRLAVAALALEELHAQLQVAHATGRLLQPLNTASERQPVALAGLDSSR